MHRAFRSSPFTGIDGSILVTNDGGRIATERDMEWFWQNAEPELDRLTLEMCATERLAGNKIEAWLLQVELAAFQRSRLRVA